MNKSYEEMICLPSFKERFEYLQLYGKVGSATFGDNRYLNQLLYHMPQWQSIRRQVIIRDNCCDMALPDYEIRDSRLLIHHINPITVNDILDRNHKVFDLNNLVLVSPNTHNAIHYGGQAIRKMLMTERAPNDTCPWKE